MKRLIVVLCVSLLTLTPPVWIDKLLAPWLPRAEASNFAGAPLTEDEAKALAYRFVPGLAGLDFTVVITTSGSPNAMFSWGNGDWSGVPSALILLRGLQDFPRQTQVLIFLHELAHANQLLNVGFESDIVKTEWEADVQGVRWACELGIDSGWVPYFWVWLYQNTGYDGDESHPPAAQRASLNTTCPDLKAP